MGTKDYNNAILYFGLGTNNPLEYRKSVGQAIQLNMEDKNISFKN